MKKKVLIVILLVILLSVFSFGIYKIYQYHVEQKRLEEEKLRLAEEKKLIEEIKERYNSNVITTSEAQIYSLIDNEYKLDGLISKDVVLTLEEITIDSKTEYFKILGLDNDYYIKYQDVNKYEEEAIQDQRYLNYIKFDKEIITKEVTRFHFEDKLIYSINKSFTFSVYIIDGDKYYVEYNGKLMYILKEDIETINDKQNSVEEKATQISTIAYHFIYNPNNGEVCNEIICHTTDQIQSHIDYLKSNNYFTLTMNEFEMWIDGKLNLPKNSIMITVDDGAFAYNAAKIFTDNKINATIFVVSSWFDPKVFETEYFEIHSHGHNLHNAYACPGYGKQGGGILCLPKANLLEDLKTSRERTNMTTAFAYPFYDVNEYAIETLKEAGFTMAFGGTYANGRYNMTVGANKFKIPRVTMLNYSSVNDLKNILLTN